MIPRKPRKPRKAVPQPYPLQIPTLHPDGRVTIYLPIPHRMVSPNAGRGQSVGAALVKSRAILAHKTAGFLATVDAMARFPGCGPFIGYTLAHFFKTIVFRDDDNADGACKAYRDGIAKALHMNDRDLRKVALSTQAKDATRPRVEITLHLSPPNQTTSAPNK